jgi:hypothetical protein
MRFVKGWINDHFSATIAIRQFRGSPDRILRSFLVHDELESRWTEIPPSRQLIDDGAFPDSV